MLPNLGPTELLALFLLIVVAFLASEAKSQARLIANILRNLMGLNKK